MLNIEKLIEILKIGREAGFISKRDEYNPYHKTDTYDWEFDMKIGDFTYSDSFMDGNPFSGLERIYENDDLEIPLWYSEYVCHLNSSKDLSEDTLMDFLKLGRSSHLIETGIDFFGDYEYTNGKLIYKSSFSGDILTVIQSETILLNENIVGRQVWSGGMKLDSGLAI